MPRIFCLRQVLREWGSVIGSTLARFPFSGVQISHKPNTVLAADIVSSPLASRSDSQKLM